MMLEHISNLFKVLRRSIIIFFTIFLLISISTRLYIVNSLYFIVFALILVLFKYLESLFISLNDKNNISLEKSMKYYFVIYILLLIYALFLDRNINIFNFDNWLSHISLSNIVPFYSTINMVKAVYLYGNYEALSIIIGNIIMLSPMAFFLPRLFKEKNNFKSFFIKSFLITLSIEIVQLVTDTGYFDIDDIILNVGGTILFYYLFNKTFLKKILDSIFLLEKNEISKKEYVLSILVILLVLVVFALTIKYYYVDPVGSDMEIICEKDNCVGDDVLLYDDGNYLYYVKEDCVNDLYIDFKHDKYLLKDYLEGSGRKVYYNYYKIKDIQFRFSNYISIKNKYYESSVTYSNREILIEYKTDEEYLEVEEFNTYITLDEYTGYYRLKGKKAGESTLKIIIRNFFNNDEILDTIEIKYKIDEELNVSEKVV